MTKVLVTGGAGFVGRALLEAAQAEPSLQILALRNRAPVQFVPASQTIAGGWENNGRFERAVREADHIVWFAAERDHFASRAALWRSNVQPIERVGRIVAAANARPNFIYISTISVADGAADASRPITNRVVAPPVTPYGESKLTAEQVVRTHFPRHSILRLPFMYGPVFSPRSHMRLWRSLVRVRAQRVLRLEGALSLLHNRDLAQIILNRIAGRASWPEAGTHLITDGNVYDLEQIVDAVEKALGIPRKRLARRVGVSPVFRYLSRFRNSAPAYWSRLLAGGCHFAARRDAPPAIEGFPFTPLGEGMRLSYRGPATHA